MARKLLVPWDFNGLDAKKVGTLTFGTGEDVGLSRGAADRLDLATGDSFRIVAGQLQIGADTVLERSSADNLRTPDSFTVLGDFTAVNSAGGPEPTAAGHLATKGYVDGHTRKFARAATIAVLPNSPTYSNGTSGVGATLTAGSNAALAAIDDISLSLNEVVLVKNQATRTQNGLYYVSAVGSGAAPWVLTRVTIADQADEWRVGTPVFVTEGTVNVMREWVLWANTNPPVIGTTSLYFISAGGEMPNALNEDMWHDVGTTGEPAFTNGASVVGQVQVAFRKDRFGNVLLRGRVDGLTSGTGAQNIFTLPVGYRPAALHHHPSTSSTGVGVVAGVATNGVVSRVSAGSASSTIQLGGVTFYVGS